MNANQGDNVYPFEIDDSVSVACAILKINDTHLLNLVYLVIATGQDVEAAAGSLNIDFELAKNNVKNVTLILNDSDFKNSCARLNRFTEGSAELIQLMQRIDSKLTNT
jgi:hypothetical protein